MRARMRALRRGGVRAVPCPAGVKCSKMTTTQCITRTTSCADLSLLFERSSRAEAWARSASCPDLIRVVRREKTALPLPKCSPPSVKRGRAEPTIDWLTMGLAILDDAARVEKRQRQEKRVEACTAQMGRCKVCDSASDEVMAAAVAAFLTPLHPPLSDDGELDVHAACVRGYLSTIADCK